MTGEELAPADAFGRLADATRLDVLRALDAARDRSVSFSDLRGRVGVGDSGQFNYHLSRLRPHFVEKSDDGYRLTATSPSTTARGPRPVPSTSTTSPTSTRPRRRWFPTGSRRVTCSGSPCRWTTTRSPPAHSSTTTGGPRRERCTSSSGDVAVRSTRSRKTWTKNPLQPLTTASTRPTPAFPLTRSTRSRKTWTKTSLQPLTTASTRTARPADTRASRGSTGGRRCRR